MTVSTCRSSLLGVLGRVVRCRLVPSILLALLAPGLPAAVWVSFMRVLRRVLSVRRVGAIGVPKSLGTVQPSLTDSLEESTVDLVTPHKTNKMETKNKTQVVREPDVARGHDFTLRKKSL